MRVAYLAAALAALSSHAHAGPRLPALGLYCPVGEDVPPISVDADGGLGIDLLDCEGARFARARVRAEVCFANGDPWWRSTPTSSCAATARFGTGA